VSGARENIVAGVRLFKREDSAYNPRSAMPEHEHRGPLIDDQLLNNIRQGCSACFGELFHRYCRQVYSVAFRILRDRSETEDIVQEVFLEIFLQRERFDPTRASLRTWILQFAYFKALLRRRYLNVRNFYKQEEISETTEIRRNQSTHAFGMTSAEWARFVESGIAILNPKQRQVIELVHFEGYTLQEAAENVRESLANTRNYYYRGLKALRDFLVARRAVSKAAEAATLERNNDYGFES
jgi:RNA polymerase sigma-70 factor, ECF subfamily